MGAWIIASPAQKFYTKISSLQKVFNTFNRAIDISATLGYRFFVVIKTLKLTQKKAGNFSGYCFLFCCCFFLLIQKIGFAGRWENILWGWPKWKWKSNKYHATGPIVWRTSHHNTKWQVLLCLLDYFYSLVPETEFTFYILTIIIKLLFQLPFTIQIP